MKIDRKWHFIFGIYYGQLTGRIHFDFGLFKITSYPNDGAPFEKKHYKGFWIKRQFRKMVIEV